MNEVRDRRTRVLAVTLVILVAGAVLLKVLFSAQYWSTVVFPIVSVICVLLSWMTYRAIAIANDKTSTVVSGISAKPRIFGVRRGLLMLLAAIGWTYVVVTLRHMGVVGDETHTILWMLAPSFGFIVVGMVYLVRGFGMSDRF